MNECAPPSHATMTLQKGQFLFRQGDCSRDFYIVNSGSVRVFKTEGGVDVDLEQIRGPGGVVGEIASIDHGPRSASVVACEETLLYRISSDSFASLLQSVPDWLGRIAGILAKRLREVDRRIDFTLPGDKTDQIAGLLFLMASAAPPMDGGPFYVGRKELENEALDICNSSFNETTDALEKLKTRGIIRVEQKGVAVACADKLSDAAAKLFSVADNEPTCAT